ncbi:ABC transporter ATP-binding protein [Brevirhabdus pacifica]|uniref:ABC transporter ATP-binding protein n=1 Tax=Brevirhabdus pacifica TaxID=1267768 RepID=A0A1U7DLH0_9RHOB|nr:ABC transporter ATP-binding protein [Brevirhabdus pacifica]APX90765.1 ABC transporter ATP-binding protein [Brevirhabdus pacifica]OWU79552.1 ABC transporter ATPase [Loktanella sp. 22II-4b]PJJ87357.1 putative hydroxymethylpyrimidine transport system ATP-binding protein [Brevirhabdus pacifica]
MTPAPGITLAGEARIAGQPLFAPLTLEVGAGVWTCLLGPSGVGKTTILRLIAGLETGADFTGTITASDGQPLAGRVALMAQSDLLLPWASALDNVSLGARLRGERRDRDRAMEMLERVGLEGLHARKPARLSGGQRQRVALARTLLEDRPVVLLDEPFSALDARTRSEMQDLAAELLAGRTVLLVTHDPAEAARLGRAIHVMGTGGLETVESLPPPHPRAVDDAELLMLQGRLLARLRQQHADAPGQDLP